MVHSHHLSLQEDGEDEWLTAVGLNSSPKPVHCGKDMPRPLILGFLARAKGGESLAPFVDNSLKDLQVYSDLMRMSRAAVFATGIYLTSSSRSVHQGRLVRIPPEFSNESKRFLPNGDPSP